MLVFYHMSGDSATFYLKIKLELPIVPIRMNKGDFPLYVAYLHYLAANQLPIP